MLKATTFTILFVSSLLLLAACDKNNDSPATTSAQIHSISPDAGKYGILDTIRGNHFGNSMNEVEVFFNNVAAPISAINDTLIVVTVPKEAGGYVSIKKNNSKITGPAFHYLYTVTVSTLAGQGFAGYRDGTASNALFNFPRGLAMDSSGNLYVADFGNNCIRKISADGNVSTVAGNGIKSYRDGPAPDAEFYAVNGLAINQDNLYIADASRLRVLYLTNRIVNTIAGNDANGKKDGNGINAEFSLIYGVAATSAGTIFVTDVNNNSIRKIIPNGTVTTFAGSESGYRDGMGSNAFFNLPGQLVYDANTKNIYLADAGNFRIRNIDPAGNVFTFAGNGNYGFKDGRFYNAEFTFPTGITVDAKSNVYVCGEENAIRKIDSHGDVTTIAGSGIRGFKDGSGETAMFNQPIYMTIDKTGTLYVSDQSNHSIRKIIIE